MNSNFFATTEHSKDCKLSTESHLLHLLWLAINNLFKQFIGGRI
jgi:hypothetical protein